MGAGAGGRGGGRVDVAGYDGKKKSKTAQKFMF